MSEEATTEAIQAMERLSILFKQNKKTIDETVLQKCKDSLENLRFIKSSLEGSAVMATCPKISESCLQELKQLTLMHIPSSLTDTVRKRFQQLIVDIFTDADVEILYAVLVTCPWYSCTQKERGEQAKYNSIFILYKTTTQKFFLPISQHLQDQISVINMDWLYACELNHFVQFLVKGKTRNVEALYCSKEAVLYESEQLTCLRNVLSYNKVMKLRQFVEACRGQSMSGIGKKGKDGKFRINGAATFRQLCDSFRLMHQLYNTIHNLALCNGDIENLESTPEIVCKAIQLLQRMYQNPDVSKVEVFDLLCQWRQDINKVMITDFTKVDEVQNIVGEWHIQQRLVGLQLSPVRCMDDDQSKLLTLMTEIGGPVARLKPEQILLLTRAGSNMYGLSTETSDVDYMIIYAEQTELILKACKRLSESVENRGPTKHIEYGAYEARCFAEMLWKGSVVMLELVYKDDHEYMNPVWQALSNQKQAFVTEQAIQQHMGLIRNNIKMIENEKYRDLPQERKLFYQIYHKLNSVEYIMRNKHPPVRCSGPIRDFILRVRTAPLEGDLCRENLYKDCVDKIEKVRDYLACRKTRLKENCDFNILADWILTVRGITSPGVQTVAQYTSQ